MNTHAERTLQKKRPSGSAGSAKEQRGDRYLSSLDNNQPQLIAQASRQQMMNSSPKVTQLESLQEQLNNTQQQTHQAVQLQRNAVQLSSTMPVQRAIDDDLQALEDDYQNTDDPLLFRILNEIRLLSDVDFTSVNDPEQGHAKRQDEGTRSHLINLDPRITDPVTRQSLLLHELIHVSADRKYNINQTDEPDPALTAVINPLASEGVRLADAGEQFKYRGKLATHLESVVKGDWVVKEEAADLVLDRVKRIGGASHREFDSVISELYYRLKKMGVDERSDTFKEVAAMAAAAYRSRNEGIPLDRTYVEPMKTGFLG